MGVAPAQPGMPESASMPDQPCATAWITTSSQTSPAATRTITADESADSSEMPLVALRTTEPAKPSSETTRFEPPATTSNGSSASSTSRMASTSSSVVCTVTRRCAGPPTRMVVNPDKETPCSSRTCGSVHDDQRRGQARRLDIGTALVGHDHGLGESGAVLDDTTGVADPVADHVDRRAHGEHSMGDDIGKPHGPGETLIPMEAVTVQSGPGVGHQARTADVNGCRRQLLADLHVIDGKHGVTHLFTPPRG